MDNPILVTCYYKIESKRPHEHYLKYIDLFLTNLQNDVNLVLYTSIDLVSMFEKYTEIKPNIKIIVKEFEQIPLYKKYIEIWDAQYKLDNQKKTGRSWKCYVLWNSKINFITETIDLNLFGISSNKYIWIDIGCVRDKIHGKLLTKFPNSNKISENKIDIVLLKDFAISNQKYFQDQIHFAGAIFGGTSNTFKILSELYYKKFDEYLSNNQFIGCDQQIISSVYLENKELFNLVKTRLQKINGIDPWFNLLSYYSK
jgi:hypothetical protein